MAKAKKLPSGQWRVLAYAGKDPGSKRRYKSFTAGTKRKAELAAMEWQEHYKAVTRNTDSMTVSEAIDAHIAAECNILSPSTIAGYHRIQKNRLKEIMGVPLNKLTERLLQEEANIESGKYAPKTVSCDMGLVSALLKKYRPDFCFHLDLPTVYPVIKSIPMDDDLRKIYALAYGTEMELPILLAAWLGLRVSEIRGLRTDRIGNGRIVVEKAIVQGDNGASEKGTKSKKGTHILPLPAYIEKRAKILLSDGRKKVTALSGQAIYKRFIRICKKANVGPFRFHDLRHTNATIMLEEHVPDKYIAERGGWGTDIYKTRYEHTRVAKSRDVSEAIDQRFNAIITGKNKA